MTFKTFEPSKKSTNSTQEHTIEINALANNVNILNNTDKTPWHQELSKKAPQEKEKCRMFESRKRCRQTTKPDM